MWSFPRDCAFPIDGNYCGDGRPHTREGTTIDVFDGLGIQKRESPAELPFEAAWSPAV